jgi:hypothetical protein
MDGKKIRVLEGLDSDSRIWTGMNKDAYGWQERNWII